MIQIQNSKTIMREVKLCTIFLIFIYFLYEAASDNSHGLNAVPERAEIVYINPKYVANSTVNVRRYTRGGEYVVSLWGVIKHTWANNVTVDVIFAEYLHNEYKRSFVELHFKLCDLINKDEVVGALLRQYGLTCPLQKGPNGLMNATLIYSKFPYVFPFQKCRAEVIFKTTPGRELIGNGYLYLNIKDIGNKAKNK